MKRTAIVLLLLLFTGCFYVPQPAEFQWCYHSRGRIPFEVQGQISEGLTTKGEVLLLLGEPEFASKNERVFVYHWILKVGEICMPEKIGNIPVENDYFILLEFSGQGVVTNLLYFDEKSSFFKEFQKECSSP